MSRCCYDAAAVGGHSSIGFRSELPSNELGSIPQS